MDHRNRYPVILQLLSKAIDILLALGGMTILLLSFTNAVLRGAAGFDLAWSLEVTAFLLLWLTFMGCAAATARGAHMRVTEIVAHLVPEKFQPVLELIINIVITLLLCSLIYYGYTISQHTWAQMTTVLYWPVGLLYASLPAGMLLTLIFHIANIFLDPRNSMILAGSKSNQSEDHSWEDYE